MTVCQQCGEQNPDRFRICGMCGAPLGASAPPREGRKTVTIVFSDLQGSTDPPAGHAMKREVGLGILLEGLFEGLGGLACSWSFETTKRHASPTPLSP